MPSPLEQAKACLNSAKGQHLSEEELSSRSIELAGYMLNAAQQEQTHQEKKIQKQLAAMMQDPMGKAFTIEMTDQSFRSQNPKRVAEQITYNLKRFGTPHYLSFSKRLQLKLFEFFSKFYPEQLVSMTKYMIRRETARVILPGEPQEFKAHLQKRRQEGVRVNLNHLGEAILGEPEAERRLKIYLDDLANPDIEYISVKISTICSQINLIAWEHTLSTIMSRLQLLYDAAQNNTFVRPDGSSSPKFVNLDMEEYRDLHLTVEAFKRVLELPKFQHFSAGIVLQSYLPDSFDIQKDLTQWALKRVVNGGAPIKIRIVKGANLAMEKVEASIRDWPQAPYCSKAEVDANFKRMVAYGCTPQHAQAVHLGIGSHNLFDIAYALLLRAENAIEPYVNFEMLEGMADHMRRVVQQLSGDMLLYCPVAAEEDFQNAIAYLIRRLDENTAPENFLRHSFDLKPGSKEWETQAKFFHQSSLAKNKVGHLPQRTQNRFLEPIESGLCTPFSNEPDTDWSLPQNRHWAENISTHWATRKHNPIPLVIAGKEISNNQWGIGEDPSNPGHDLYKYAKATSAQADEALNAAQHAQKIWGSTPVQKRSKLLAAVAQGIRRNRGDLIGAMVADTGKTIPEADVEVSEAIDFAEFYRRNAEELYSLEDIKWTPKGTVLVAPPWNFPCSIPAGGILAALAAGNCVVFKPAPEAILVAWQLVQIFWDAGISKEVLQFLPCDDDPVGSMLVKDPRIAAVVLTGATSTAQLMLRLRPGIDLIAETGGKNAIILTSLCDRDLAIKDMVQSAFGHAGQKCSACSLAICDAEVYDDVHFREQLRDAAASLNVGSQWDSATRVNPLIREPNSTLAKGLTELDEGEEWLLKPIQDPSNPNLWSPGIKLGVKAGSYSHQNEFFGPVLSLMRADNLKHAIEIANGTPYGLTSGLHSLDEREQKYWLEHIQAGNCYINRTITGAIVQRQPFGGCKASSFGRGAKAGGPNYVMQLMHPEQISLPAYGIEERDWNASLRHLTAYFENNAAQKDIWRASVGSYLLFWQHYFSQEHDPSKLLGQDNLFYYVPHPLIVFRIQSGDALLDILRVIAGAIICGTPLEISADPKVISSLDISKVIRYAPSIKITPESEAELISHLMEKNRIRVLSKPSHALQEAAATAGINLIVSPVFANGRIELLNYLREVSLSVDYHRYGNLGVRENEPRGHEEPGGCCGNSCLCER